MTGDSTKTSRLAIASFLLSLASLVAGPLGFIPGIVCGHLARRRVARDPNLDDPGFAKAGLILGYVFLALTATIVTVVSAYLLFNFAGTSTRPDPKVASAQTTLVIIGAALDSYRDYSGDYPTTRQGLAALTRETAIEPIPERWRYSLAVQYLVDPWGNPFQYRQPGIRNPKTYDLWCLGPDGEAGTEDDLIGW